DNCSTVFRLPFAVRLYDRNVSQVILGSNGTLGVGANTNPGANACLPSPAFNTAVLPLWDDLTTAGAGGGIFASVSGTSPQRILNIEWRAARAGTSQRVNFEVRLYERNSRFELIYGRLDGDSGSTIGVQRDTGSLFTQVLCDPAGVAPSGGVTEGDMLVFTLPGVTPTPTACPLQFGDVPPGSAFYPFVRCLACRGIISGYPDGTFRPNNPVTRGQLAKIVSNSAGFNEPPGDRLFEDVPSEHTFYEWVQRLAARSIIAGYTCGGPGEPCGPQSLPYFRPASGSTRGQLTKIVSNGAGFDDAVSPEQYTFADVPPTHTFWVYVERLLLNRPDVMAGYPCGGPGEPCDAENRPYFRPNNPLTRGQTSKIVANTFLPDCWTPAR
ncbi:MAG TPA: S-layer homology domain-containing protein, partial [Chloroflexia bacterium]|nr:S-layer homology domain-containing protein [Chloroflexia bacterium]